MGELLKAYKLAESMKYALFVGIGVCAIGLGVSGSLVFASLLPTLVGAYAIGVYLRVEMVKANSWNKIHEPEDYDTELEAYLEGKKK